MILTVARTWLCILMLLPAFAYGSGERDPFMPLPDPCTSPLNQAGYRGVVVSGTQLIALVETAKDSWQSWSRGMQLTPGWQVRELTPNVLMLGGPEGCKPQPLLRSGPILALDGRAILQAGTGQKAIRDQRITLAADDVPALPLIQAVALSQAINIAIAPGGSGRVSMRLSEVGWQQAMSAITNSAGLAWQLKENILQIQPATQRPAATPGKRAVALMTETFNLRHIQAQELITLLNNSHQLSQEAGASAVADSRTNRLLVADTRAGIARLRGWIDKLDVPLGQVELAAHIVTMNRQSLNALGVQWSRGGHDLPTRTGVNVNLEAQDASSWVGFNIARIGGRALGMALSALEQKHQLEIVASPRLLATHQQPASIKQGSEIPYQVSSGSNGRTSVEFKDAVLGMDVTPEILEGRRIRLKLRITQNMPGQKLRQADGEILTIEKQEIETQVVVNNDETLALGGIFQQKQHGNSDGVPLLSKLPLLGGFFRYRGNEHERRELVVFITPRIIFAP